MLSLSKTTAPSETKTTAPSETKTTAPSETKTSGSALGVVVTKADNKTEGKEANEDEPMLKHDSSRLVLMPIKHPKLWLLYKKMEASIWHASEISKQIPGDLPDWEQLSKNVQHFLKHVLAFFSSSDTIVMENLALRFMREVKWPEAIFFYGLQIFVEQVHSETYGLLIDTYISDPVEKRHLFNAIETVPVIAKKAAWALKWIESKESSFAERLVAFACVEGIFFSGSFCAIFWIKKSGKMRAMTFSNELISRDEGLHCDFAIALHSMLVHKCSTETIQRIVREAVAIEHEFVTDALPVSLIGMNAATMQQYICYIADSILDAFGCPKIWNVQQPFDWMQLIDLRGKSNFFEITPSEYQDATVMSELRKSNPSASSSSSSSSSRAVPPPPSSFIVEPDF